MKIVKQNLRKIVCLLVNIYLRESQCILATLSPGNVNNVPITAAHTANDNFNISFEAGPLEIMHK